MIPEMATLAPLVGLLLASGAFAGLLAGMLGVGGGIVHVPAFFFVFTTLGYGGPQLMQVCLATSLAAIVITSLRSVAAHARRGAVDWSILKRWAPGIAGGAVIGVIVAARVRSEPLEALFGVVATLVGLYLLFGRPEWRLGSAMPVGPARAALSSLVGFLSVLMGIGGGTFGVPLMTLFGISMHNAVATSAGFGALIAVPSVIAFLLVDIAGAPPMTVGAINLPAVLVAVSTTMVTAPIGARIAHGLNALTLRRAFAVFILVVAATMVMAAFG
jgi:uncharacterized membrane protein YfcA